jgi:hypothetical protein
MPLLFFKLINLVVGSTLSLDLEQFITESTTTARLISTGRDQTRAIYSALDRLRLVLSTLLTPGLNTDIDALCREKLGVPMSTVHAGFSRSDLLPHVYSAYGRLK